MTGTLEHHPLPSPPRDSGPEGDEATQPAPVLGELSDPEEEAESESTPGWFDRIQERLGAGVSSDGTLRLSPRVDEPKLPSEPVLVPSAGSSDVLNAQNTLASLSRQTSAIADSVNIIDHQFKLQILGRVGSLEKQIRELEEKMQRTFDACKGIEQRLNNRRGAPCDVIERLDSMTSFTYAFCKSMEDAGVFKLQKKYA